MNTIDLQQIREEYSQHTLDVSDVDKNPFRQFEVWFKEAVESEVKESNAMTLSTVDGSGKPHNRVVLLKGFGERGFTFYTNQASKKGEEIAANPNVAIGFFWIELERQILVEGIAEKISKKESEHYFKSRPYMSQIGALASNQSEVVESREYLDLKFKALVEKYPEGSVPMPETWGGYLIKPSYFEFWQGRRSRLHDRIIYRKEDKNWVTQRLSP
ncbi:MAG: pyridoxamine 5'-phosphate oxidase [Balneolaceae bacterium]